VASNAAPSAPARCKRRSLHVRYRRVGQTKVAMPPMTLGNEQSAVHELRQVRARGRGRYAGHPRQLSGRE
jgi:hypothetical protein